MRFNRRKPDMILESYRVFFFMGNVVKIGGSKHYPLYNHL